MEKPKFPFMISFVAIMIEELNMQAMWDRINDESAEPLDFYFPSNNNMLVLDKKCEMTIEVLLTNISKIDLLNVIKWKWIY